MSLPPGRYVGHPEYPDPWSTTRPLEGLRDNAEARIVSLSPDVCLTPVGSSVVPIPYPVVDNCGDDEAYTPSVRFTKQRTMVMRSNTTCVHGDAPGTRKGVKSGTVGDICEPIGHASKVRAEGSEVIRHLDRFHMNKQNTVGEAIFVRDMGTYTAPTDTDPVPGSLVMSDWVVQEPYIAGEQYAQVQLAQADPAPVEPPVRRPPPADPLRDMRPTGPLPPAANDNRAPTVDRRGPLGRPVPRGGGAAGGAIILEELGRIGELNRMRRLARGLQSDHGITIDWDNPDEVQALYDYSQNLGGTSFIRRNFFPPMTEEEALEQLQADLDRARQAPVEETESEEEPERETRTEPAPDTVRIDREDWERPCIVGPYEHVEGICDGEAHHIVPDMAYRLGARPTTAADRASTANRIPNAPTFNQGMSICLTPEQHGSGPTGLHGRLRGRLNTLGAASPVAGTAPMGQILAVSLAEINSIPDLPAACKALAALSATTQVQAQTGVAAPGRTQQSPLPTGEARRVLQAGSY